MIRRMLAIGALVMLTIGAVAQDAPVEAPVLHEIPLPFVSSMFTMAPDGTVVAVFEHAVMANNEPAGTSLPILLIDTSDGSEIGRLDGVQVDLTRDAAFSPDGTRLVSYHINGDLIVWDVATQEAVQVYEWLPIGGGLVDYLADGQSLSIVTANGLMGQHVLFDLAAGSITSILGLRPDTYQELNEQLSDTLTMGMYSIAGQATGPNGELYGASGNGEVYRWEIDERLRVMLSPESTEGPLRFNIRRLQPLSDGSLVFYDRDLEMTVRLAADGTRTEYPFKADVFVVSQQGLMVYFANNEHVLYRVDLNAETPEPEPISPVLPDTEDEEPRELRGDVTLALTPSGDLVVGGLAPMGDMGSAIYIIDLP